MEPCSRLGVSTRRRKSKNWLVLATEYNVNYVNLRSWTCAVQAKGLRNEWPNGQFVPFDDCFDLSARVVRTVGRHEHGGIRQDMRISSTFRTWARFWRKLTASLRDPYRPEQHYMRGRGPRWHAKHPQ